MTNAASTESKIGTKFTINYSSDWTLLVAAGATLLSFLMLFPPWVTGVGISVNAFGQGMQAAGPALIIVMALAVIILLYCTLITDNRRYVVVSLIPAFSLLIIYIVKLSDVSDLIDLNRQLTQVNASTGAGLWLGFIFAVLALIFLIVDVVRNLDRIDGASRIRPSLDSPDE
ncbi:hypothetical protein OH768_52250 [Streptomyces sp. NBC_01622]|uniref:hypothetical protein n=1 Tax=Streptomyces sp. NBC_01622 TaxID=2975903 RepID=UPI003864C5AB|nr:hypothetical protein OH768_52250 [Streptomyces sp. NBC_01622]